MGDICYKEVYNLFMLMHNLLYINTEVLTIVLFIFCNCSKGAKAIGIGTRDFRSILRLTPKLSMDTIRRVAYEDFFGWSSDILVENVVMKIIQTFQMMVSQDGTCNIRFWLEQPRFLYTPEVLDQASM